MRRAAWCFGFVAACQALPSSVPLFNTGGVVEDDGTARDRRAPSAGSEQKSEASVPRSAPSSPARSTNVAGGAPLPDAGQPSPSVTAADGGVAVQGFAGEYYGSDKLVRHFEGDSDDVELDDKAHTRVEEPTPGALVISIVNSATGETICALKATAHGAEAGIDPGQSCFSEEGANATVTSGHASLAGDRLVLDFSGKVVSDPDDDGDTLEFELEYHFDGRRR